jgi:cytochrome P450
MTAGTDVATFPSLDEPRLRHDPVLDEWRRTDPVRRVRLPHGRWCWVVTRYDDVKTVMDDTVRFSRRAAANDDSPRRTPTVVQKGSLASMDGPDHARLRRLLSRDLTVRRMEALRPSTQACVDRLLDGIERRGPVADLVPQLALAVPVAVIADLLGVPSDDQQEFRSWAEGILSTGVDATTGRPISERSIASLHGYLGALVAQRRREPSDDLVSALVAVRDDGDTLTEDELIHLAFTLLGGGFETTATMIGKSVVCLIDHPDQLGVLRSEPGLWPAAVDELLRWLSLGAGTALPHEALVDVQLSGVNVRAGDYVITAPSSANADEQRFVDADRFDVRRVDGGHLGLGHGPHYCLGANLAKMEMHVTLQTLFERLPSLRLAVPEDELAWRPASALWALAALPVEW